MRIIHHEKNKLTPQEELLMYTNPRQFYIDPKHTYVSPVFQAADRLVAERHKNDPEVVTKPIEVPMPFIHGCPGANGPIIVTKDWYVKTEKKRLANRAKDKRIDQEEMMELLARRDRLRGKLGCLNPMKKEDAKQIVKINIKLRDLQAELEMLQHQSGINLNQLDHGSRFNRFIGRVKNFFKRVKKFLTLTMKS